MDKQEQVEQLTNYVAHFVAHTARFYLTMLSLSWMSWQKRKTARCLKLFTRP